MTLKKSLLPLVLISAWTAILTLSAAACDQLDIRMEQTDAGLYDPGALSPTFAQIELTVLGGPADPSCRNALIEIVSLGASNPRSFRNGPSKIKGTLPANSKNLLKVRGRSLILRKNAVSTLVSTGRLTLEYARLSPGRFVPAGLYSNALELRVNAAPQLQIRSEINVEPAIRLIGTGTQTQKTLDFGTLRANGESRSSFVYQANTPLTVSARSEFNGKLTHERGAAFGQIPYQTYLNNRSLATDGIGTLKINKNGKGRQKIGNIRVRLGDIGLPYAGEYSDILTLSFSTS